MKPSWLLNVLLLSLLSQTSKAQTTPSPTTAAPTWPGDWDPFQSSTTPTPSTTTPTSPDDWDPFQIPTTEPTTTSPPPTTSAAPTLPDDWDPFQNPLTEPTTTSPPPTTTPNPTLPDDWDPFQQPTTTSPPPTTTPGPTLPDDWDPFQTPSTETPTATSPPPTTTAAPTLPDDWDPFQTPSTEPTPTSPPPTTTPEPTLPDDWDPFQQPTTTSPPPTTTPEPTLPDDWDPFQTPSTEPATTTAGPTTAVPTLPDDWDPFQNPPTEPPTTTSPPPPTTASPTLPDDWDPFQTPSTEPPTTTAAPTLPDDWDPFQTSSTEPPTTTAGPTTTSPPSTTTAGPTLPDDWDPFQTPSTEPPTTTAAPTLPDDWDPFQTPSTEPPTTTSPPATATPTLPDDWDPFQTPSTEPPTTSSPPATTAGPTLPDDWDPFQTPSTTPFPSTITPSTAVPPTVWPNFPVAMGCYVADTTRFGVNKIRVRVLQSVLQVMGITVQGATESTAFCLSFPVSLSSNGDKLVFTEGCGSASSSYSATDFAGFACLGSANASYSTRPGTSLRNLDLIASGADMCPFRKYVINDLVFHREGSTCEGCTCSAEAFPQECMTANTTGTLTPSSSAKGATAWLKYTKNGHLYLTLKHGANQVCTSFNATMDSSKRTLTIHGNCGNEYSNSSLFDTFFYCHGAEAVYHYKVFESKVQFSALKESCQSRRELLHSAIFLPGSKCPTCGCPAPPATQEEPAATPNISCYSATNSISIPGVPIGVELALSRSQLHIKLNTSTISYCVTYNRVPGDTLVLMTSCSNVAGANIASNYLIDDLDCGSEGASMVGVYQMILETRNKVPTVRFISISDDCKIRESILTQSSFSRQAHTSCRLCSCSVFDRAPEVRPLDNAQRSELNCPLIVPNVGRAQVALGLEEPDTVIASSVGLLHIGPATMMYWGVLRRSSSTKMTTGYQIMGIPFDSNFEYSSSKMTYYTASTTEASAPKSVVTSSGVVLFCWIEPDKNQSSSETTKYNIMMAQMSSDLKQLSTPTVVSSYDSFELWPPTIQSVSGGKKVVVIYKHNTMRSGMATWFVKGMIFNDQGEKILDPFQVNTQRTGSGFDGSAALVLDLTNSFYVVWQEFKDYLPSLSKRFNKDGKLEIAEGMICYQKFANEGGKVGSERFIESEQKKQVMTFPTGSVIQQTDGSKLFVVAWMAIDMSVIENRNTPELNKWNIDYQIYNPNGDATSQRMSVVRYTGVQFDVSSATAGSNVRGTFIEGPKIFPHANGLLAQGFVLTWQQSYGYNRPFRVYVQEFDARGKPYSESVVASLDNPAGSESFPTSLTTKTQQVVLPVAYLTPQTISLALPVGSTSKMNPLHTPLSISEILRVSFNYFPDTLVAPAKNASGVSSVGGIINLTEEEFEDQILQSSSLSTPATVTSPSRNVMVTFWSQTTSSNTKTLYALYYDNNYHPAFPLRLTTLTDISDISGATLDASHFVICWRTNGQIRVMVYYFIPKVNNYLLPLPVYRIITSTPVSLIGVSAISAPIVIGLVRNTRFAVAWSNSTMGSCKIHVQLLQVQKTLDELHITTSPIVHYMSMTTNDRGDEIYLTWCEISDATSEVAVKAVLIKVSSVLTPTNVTQIASGPEVHMTSLRVLPIDPPTFNKYSSSFLVLIGKRPNQILVNTLLFSPKASAPDLLLDVLDIATDDVRLSPFDVVSLSDDMFLLVYSNGTFIKMLTVARDETGRIAGGEEKTYGPCTTYDFPSINTNPRVHMVSEPSALAFNKSVYVALSWDNVIDDASKFSDIYTYVVEIDSEYIQSKPTLPPIATVPAVVVPSDPLPSGSQPVQGQKPTQTAKPTSPLSKSSEGLNNGQVAGVVVGLLTGVLLVVLFVWLFIQKPPLPQPESNQNMLVHTELDSMRDPLNA